MGISQPSLRRNGIGSGYNLYHVIAPERNGVAFLNGFGRFIQYLEIAFRRKFRKSGKCPFRKRFYVTKTLATMALLC